MRIVFIVHNPKDSASYYRCFFLARHLVKFGHHVTIICKRWLSKHSELVNGVFVHPSPRFIQPYHVSIEAFSRSLSILKSNYDVLHILAPSKIQNSIPGLVSKYLKRKPLIVDWDDWWTRGGFLEENHSFSVLLDEGMPLIANALIVISDKLRERALSIGVDPNRLYKIPTGCNTDIITPIERDEARNLLNIAGSDPIVCHLGAIDKADEYFRLLIKTFKIVLDKEKSIKFMLVGFVNQSLFEQVPHCLRRKIIKVGRVPLYEHVHFYLQASDVLLLPMFNSLCDEARWPARLGDYLASGRPIVAGAVGEVKKVVKAGKCGLVTDPGNPSSYAEAILMLVELEDLRKILGRNARLTAERYATSFLAKRLIKIYEEVVSESN